MFGRVQQQLQQSKVVKSRDSQPKEESSKHTTQITNAKEMQQRSNLEQRCFNFSSIGKGDDFWVAGSGVIWDENTTKRGKIDSTTEDKCALSSPDLSSSSNRRLVRHMMMQEAETFWDRALDKA
jgi:hypothetical protein